MKRNPILRLLVAAIATVALSACSWFHSRPDYYTKAGETRPLEVPPDLDTPASANELVVPQTSAAAASAAAAQSSVQFVGDTELFVADSVAGTWQRVGAALERSGVGSIAARDESAHTYTLDVAGTGKAKPAGDRHWYTPVLEHLGFGEDSDQKGQGPHHLAVRVADQSGGARVSISGEAADPGAADVSHRVAQTLRENLIATMAPAAAAPVAAAVPPQSAPPAAAAPPAPAPAPPAAASVASAPPAISGVSAGGSDLHVTDSVGNTWRRVGLALERAQIGTLSGRDENAHTYTLDFDSTVETKPAETEHHWYTRILHPFGGGGAKIEHVKRSLTVRVADDAGGARVSVEGDTSDAPTADAAKRVIAVLRDRLS